MNGEIPIGRINDELIYLLPGEAEPATWHEQMDWAKSIGGDLPTRVEQAVLWAGFKGQFKREWYWSNETNHRNSGWAWGQHFLSGSQLNDYKLIEFRARAVRRVNVGEA